MNNRQTPTHACPSAKGRKIRPEILSSRSATSPMLNISVLVRHHFRSAGHGDSRSSCIVSLILLSVPWNPRSPRSLCVIFKTSFSNVGGVYSLSWSRPLSPAYISPSTTLNRVVDLISTLPSRSGFFPFLIGSSVPSSSCLWCMYPLSVDGRRPSSRLSRPCCQVGCV